MSNIFEVSTNEIPVAPCCVNPRLKQDICLFFVSNHFVFRLEILQRAAFITVITSNDMISKRFSRIFELSPSSFDHTDFSRR